MFGACEVLFALVILCLYHQRCLYVVNIVLMCAASMGVAVQSPQYLSAAFNPVSLNVLMIAVAVVGLLASRDLPSARRCLRKPPGTT
jgi:hypothetical protein